MLLLFVVSSFQSVGRVTGHHRVRGRQSALLFRASPTSSQPQRLIKRENAKTALAADLTSDNRINNTRDCLCVFTRLLLLVCASVCPASVLNGKYS